LLANEAEGDRFEICPLQTRSYNEIQNQVDLTPLKNLIIAALIPPAYNPPLA
jgi:hypothetical protein